MKLLSSISRKTAFSKVVCSIRCFSGCIAILLAASIAARAQGNLLVTPRRIVFDSKKKIQEVNLANTGQDTARYVISFMDIRMKEDGSFEQITEPDSGQRFAEQQLRIFPRSIVLAPNESQVVKVQVIKADQLEPGEYRSHIYFRAIPSQRTIDEGDVSGSSKEIAVRLMPVFGISIPVIIRSGISDTKVSFSDVSLDINDDQGSKLNLTFNRTGNMSSYGDVTVHYITPDGKTAKAVATVRGIAVYTPNDKRHFRMNLDKIPGIDYRTGKLRIAYKNQKDAGSEELAFTEIDLGSGKPIVTMAN